MGRGGGKDRIKEGHEKIKTLVEQLDASASRDNTPGLAGGRVLVDRVAANANMRSLHETRLVFEYICASVSIRFNLLISYCLQNANLPKIHKLMT